VQEYNSFNTPSGIGLLLFFVVDCFNFVSCRQLNGNIWYHLKSFLLSLLENWPNLCPRFQVWAMRPKLVAAAVLTSLLSHAILASCSTDGDILYKQRLAWKDPNNVLQSWDPTLAYPCTWFHVTCNMNNSVIRVDLGNAGISGPLLPDLGGLVNLQYLYELHKKQQRTAMISNYIQNDIFLNLYMSIFAVSCMAIAWSVQYQQY